MVSQEIERKVAKGLRKADHLKSTQAKLAIVNGLVEMIRNVLADSSGDQSDPDIHSLNQYLELCHIHKIKYQMDAVFAGVKNEAQRLTKEPARVSPDAVNHLAQRLQGILDIDADHQEARELLQALRTDYAQYLQDGEFSGANLNIAPYQASKLCIEITCHLHDVKKHPHLQERSKRYLVAIQKRTKTGEDVKHGPLCRMRFYGERLPDFELFHEELRVKPSYKIVVNKHHLEEHIFSDWLQCYKRFLKANNPQYCYGASPLTFNVFGCHKLYVKDVAKQLDQCWFSCGTLDQDSGLFFIDKRPIVAQIRMYLPNCGFCPALNQRKILLGLAVIPTSINPECEQRWQYRYAQSKRVGVIPLGNDIAISTRDTDLSPTDPLAFSEVGPTPYIERVRRYLATNDPQDLFEPAYKKLSSCMVCGAPYKLHAMKCSKCKMEFWKYALKDLGGVLNQLRYFKAVPFDQQSVAIQRKERGVRPPLSEVPEEVVSFERLWNDPQVQQMLSGEPAEEAFSLNAPPSISPLTSSGWLNLPEKLRGFFSKTYRQRKALEHAFSQAASPNFPTQPETPPDNLPGPEAKVREESLLTAEGRQPAQAPASALAPAPDDAKRAELLKTIKSLKPRQKSELSKRGVVRVVYHATMDKDVCLLCKYLDGMVMDPDDPATEIFSPPLYPGCTCRREYVLKTEKPKNWPAVTFKFPPKELLRYLDKAE